MIDPDQNAESFQLCPKKASLIVKSGIKGILGNIFCRNFPSTVL
jgi:hypothetical protein